MDPDPDPGGPKTYGSRKSGNPVMERSRKLKVHYNMIYFGIVWFNQPLEERGKKFEEKFRFFSLSPRSLNSSIFAR
jgi:hypothetical protein